MTKMDSFFWGLAIGILTYAGGIQLHHKQLERKAHECAVTSDLTDSGIEACYAKYRVAFPGYFNAAE